MCHFLDSRLQKERAELQQTAVTAVLAAVGHSPPSNWEVGLQLCSLHCQELHFCVIIHCSAAGCCRNKLCVWNKACSHFQTAECIVVCSNPAVVLSSYTSSASVHCSLVLRLLSNIVWTMRKQRSHQVLQLLCVFSSVRCYETDSVLRSCAYRWAMNDKDCII